jgi:DNA polymerase-3 subunit delta'
LQIDTASPDAMEKALRRYNGKAMINSVSGKKASMDAIFPLAKKYGGVVVALTLDENGIPDTVEGRIDIAKRILSVAAEYGIDEKEAMVMAHVAQGSYTAALKRMETENEEKMFFDLFVQLMRLSYMRRIKDMRAWSEQVSEMGRESQKRLLEYCQRLIRENFMYNFKNAELVYETTEEAAFSTNFARFVNEKNVIPIMEELSLCQRDIAQNVNPKMVFFDFALKMIVLLIQ